MKNRGLLIVVTTLVLATATPAMARWYDAGNAGQRFDQWVDNHPEINQELSNNPYAVYNPQWRAEHPSVQRFLERHPDVWAGLRAESVNYYNARFRDFLYNHPEIAREIAQNPSLMYEPEYLENHPGLQRFLSEYRTVWRVPQAAYASAPSGYGDAWGDYDENRNWHDYYWWHQNRPDWFWTHHPEWAANEPAWRDYDGDFDENRQWHDRNWWAQNRADWVRTHHHDWGDWDENRQWHDRDWWAQNRADWVARNHANWMQQRQNYDQALRNAQARAQQQDLKIKQLREQQQAEQAREQRENRQDAARDQQQDMRIKQLTEQQRADQMREQRERQQDAARLDREQKMHKMPPVGVGANNDVPPMHKMPPASVGMNNEPPIHKMPPIAAEPRTPQNNADVAQQNMKMRNHGKGQPAPQGAVDEPEKINSGAGQMNH